MACLRIKFFKGTQWFCFLTVLSASTNRMYCSLLWLDSIRGSSKITYEWLFLLECSPHSKRTVITVLLHGMPLCFAFYVPTQTSNVPNQRLSISAWGECFAPLCVLPVLGMELHFPYSRHRVNGFWKKGYTKFSVLVNRNRQRSCWVKTIWTGL